MNNRDAFLACSEAQIEHALRLAWETGYCRSCGWHSALYEVYEDLEPEADDLVEWHTYCHSKDRDGERDCKGCYIYPVFDASVEVKE